MVAATTKTTNATRAGRDSKLPLAPIPAVNSERSLQTSTAENAASFGGPHVEVFSFSDFVKYRLGCDLFSGSSWRTSLETEGKVVTPAKAMMALSFKAESMPAGPDAGELIVQLVKTFSKPSAFTFKALPDSFDHGASSGLLLHCATLQVTLATATESEGPLFLMHPPGHIDQRPWVIATPDASTVLQVFRRGWISVDVIARELARQGARFSTVSAVGHRYVAAPALPIRGLGNRTAAFQPTVADYNEYLRRREALLRGPRGRAALMHGGIVSRIARDVLDVDAVLGGPSLDSITVGQHGRFLLFDDRLTLDDLDIICGVYYVPSEGATSLSGGQRGDGTRTHLSWWLQARAWDSSHCFLRAEWTELAEEFYQKWLARRAENVADGIFGATSWRSKMRRQNTVTAAIDECSEHYQLGYLQDHLRNGA